MTSRDNNRVVRPFEWGSEWANRWPVPEDLHAAARPDRQAAMLDYWSAVNDHIVANSDDFYAYKAPTDFRIEHRKVELFHTGSEPPKKQPKDEWGKFLRFTSAVESPYPENNCMNARWFPARGRRAVILLPQWNADGVSQNGLCRIFNLLGISALRMSMPYHDIRRPAGLTRADYAVSANIGRTIDAGRQAIIDIRSCLDWLQAARLHAPRHRRHQPRLVLRVYGGRARPAHQRERLQSRFHHLRRCDVDRPIHAAHSPEHGNRADARRSCATCGCASAPSCISTSSSAGPRSR